MDIEQTLSSQSSIGQVPHLREFSAIFSAMLEYTCTREEQDADAKPLVLTNAYAYDEAIKTKFTGPDDPFYRYASSAEKPSAEVLSFGKKFWQLPESQQGLFREQLLWHSRTAKVGTVGLLFLCIAC